MKRSYDFSGAIRNPYLKRIIVSVKIENVRDPSQSVICDAVVDIDASLMVLRASWKGRFGELESTRIMGPDMVPKQGIEFEVCGPVRIQLEGFRPIFTEVSFVEMKTEDEKFKPLIGHIVLAQSQAAVDMLGHRLVPIKHLDLK